MRPSLRIGGLAAAAVAVSLALRALESHHVPHRRVLGIAALAGVTLAAARALRGSDREPRAGAWDHRDAALLAAIALLSSSVRLIGARSFPLGLFVDEEHFVVEASRAVVDPAVLLPWRTVVMRAGWVELPGPWYAWPAAVFAVFGVSFGSVKAVSLLPGIATPLALYGFVRSLWGREAAFLAGVLMSGSSWHGAVSRWGWIQVASTLVLLLAYHAVSSGRPIPAALLLGAGAYLYEALRVPIVAAMVLLALRGVTGCGSPLPRRLWAFSVLLVTLLPLGFLYGSRPELLLVRAREVSLYRDIESAGSLRPVAASVARYLLMFHQTGSPNPRLHPPGEPYLDPVTGGLLLLGTAACLRGSAGAAVVLTGLLASLAPGIITRLADAPHGFRTGAAAPFAFALAGLGAATLARAHRPLGAVAVAASFLLGADLLWRRWPEAMGPEPPLGPGARLEAMQRARDAFRAGRPAAADEALQGPAWNAMVGGAISGSGGILLADPDRGHELSCREREVVRDRFSRPLLLVGEGCVTQPPAGGLAVERWDGDGASGPPARRAVASRIDESPCVAAPCRLRFHGSLQVDVPGSYELETYADDGSSVAVDGQRVIDNRGESLGRRRGGRVDLAAGSHAIEITYVFLRGERRLRVLWKPPAGSWEALPPGRLSP